ncbi:hypothetical protein ROZALSC1DRAFT_31307 [Rozella allomycis CSF55]|uniref:Uncharacterized protein n=1 Tax=Rozella allomycis (strain CSF55) TaxID=988480 RepID=A0A4P9YC42_ROZAC|nr:hypothetical protein ROZALSC1DRAFT_31307 [Rozella allomycis CSF55]
MLISHVAYDFLLSEIIDNFVKTFGFDSEITMMKMDSIGYRVGYSLSTQLTKDKPKLFEDLDAVKLLCRDLWSLIFGKQIDNLKTNNRGTFVLQDYCLRWLENKYDRKSDGLIYSKLVTESDYI